MNDFNIKICPVCKKRFVPSLYWAYKKKTVMKIIYYCSYHCFREAGGGREKYKNEPKKRGKKYE